MICSISVVHVTFKRDSDDAEGDYGSKMSVSIIPFLEELSLNAFRFKIFLSPNGSGRIWSLTPIRVKANK